MTESSAAPSPAAVSLFAQAARGPSFVERDGSSSEPPKTSEAEKPAEVAKDDEVVHGYVKPRVATPEAPMLLSPRSPPRVMGSPRFAVQQIPP